MQTFSKDSPECTRRFYSSAVLRTQEPRKRQRQQHRRTARVPCLSTHPAVRSRAQEEQQQCVLHSARLNDSLLLYTIPAIHIQRAQAAYLPQL